MPHFNLVTLAGDSLGAVELGGRDWLPGSVISRGAKEPDLRVVGCLKDAEHGCDPEVLAILIVKEA